MKQCPDCGAEVIPLIRYTGRIVDCNPGVVGFRLAPTRAGMTADERHETFVSDRGDVYYGVRTTDGLHPEKQGYVPHWETCPQGRKGKRRR